ncbi:50S ribosomal protein L18 [Alkalibaculum sp. M08DMB]|uniref:Large ribosomal subunit protein uL18 n=1 Tax=Alkalibaculum sporogenes TaxID=2655001 RepID=A0A6A7K6N9_9FIRM|nr:50S ribosomal protein L18 [Alkalibaculum sporogenes]MPW25011.1 50S ribosomal protein L18 [Alkalibaculum sporogenes]
MIKKPLKNKVRKNRHKRLRFKINGTSQKPRLNVFRSNLNIYAQVVDDVQGITIVAASSLDKDVKDKIESTSNKDVAKIVGKIIGEKALSKGIETVIFDRGGYVYHGRIKELADGAREAGLKF